jgi:hypothetical protein
MPFGRRARVTYPAQINPKPQQMRQTEASANVDAEPADDNDASERPPKRRFFYAFSIGNRLRKRPSKTDQSAFCIGGNSRP